MELPHEIIYNLSLECAYGTFSVCKKYHKMYDDFWLENFFSKNNLQLFGVLTNKELYVRYIKNKQLCDDIWGIKIVDCKDIYGKDSYMILQYDGKLIIKKLDEVKCFDIDVVDICRMGYITHNKWFGFFPYYFKWLNISAWPNKYKKIINKKINQSMILCAISEDNIVLYKIKGWMFGQCQFLYVKNALDLDINDEIITVVDVDANIYKFKLSIKILQREIKGFC